MLERWSSSKERLNLLSRNSVVPVIFSVLVSYLEISHFFCVCSFKALSCESLCLMKCSAKSLQCLFKSIKRFEFTGWLLCREDFHCLHTFLKQEFAETDSTINNSNRLTETTARRHWVTHSLKERGKTIEKYSEQDTSGLLLPPAEIIRLLALTMTADSVTQ